jgi:hypothetical protein
VSLSALFPPALGFDTSFVGEVGSQLRQYRKFGNFDLGAAITETEQIKGVGGKKQELKRCIGLVPLDGQLDYYEDLDEVVSRLSAAALKVVAQYNALKLKKTVVWREVICAQSWTAVPSGKEEVTKWQQELSTFHFHNSKQRFTRPMTVADLKV